MRSSRGRNWSGRAQRADRWLCRALVAVVAVIGVVAMHGLTMNHDAAMASMSTVIPFTAAGAWQLDPMTSAGNGPSDMNDAVSRVATKYPPNSMATACLAFLPGLVLLVGAGPLVGRIRPEAITCPSRHSVSWFATALERLRPDLGELSVLRT